ncbi:MCHR2 protein, partial [Atrichornis clamosus]|nr:MCHR2 protein [Atrichornis clamosus]
QRNIPDIYICNLAIADLVQIIGMPFLIHQWARGSEWVFGSPLCTTITSLDTCNHFTCSAIMTAVSWDRYPYLIVFMQSCSNSRTRMLSVTLNDFFKAAGIISDVCGGGRNILSSVWHHALYETLRDPNPVLLYTLYLTITTFFSPLPLIFICCILILCYTWEMFQQNKKGGSYTTTIPRQRVMRLTRMVLALISMFLVSTVPFHVIQLMNLQASQPILTFYVSCYISICLSDASSSVNPFLCVLLTGNFQKHLQQYTNVEVRMVKQDVNITEYTLKSSF